MKIRLYLMALLMTSLFFAACKESSSTDPDPAETGDTENYLPNGVGTNYTFDVVRQDSTGATTTGTRFTSYTGIVNLNGPLYTEQTDSLVFGQASPANKSYFRKTDNGAYYYLDTTGLGETIPDSLLQYISFDSEIRYLAFPLNEGSSWPVFKMSLSYFINLTIVEVTADVVGKENLTLNLNTGTETKEALKIKYVLTLRMPDPENMLSILSYSFEAHGWIIKNVGFAKWEGNAAVLGAFAGTGIDFGDSTVTVTQNLIQYSIK